MDINLSTLPENRELALNTLESKLLTCPQDFEAPVFHRFGPGLYIRELHIPKNIIGMGHKQKLPHMNNFVSGRIRLYEGDGSFSELVAPMTFVGLPGRKTVHVLEDMVWQNIYATDETDVEILEETYLDKTEESVKFYSSRRHSDDDLKAIHEDFNKVLSEFNLTKEYVRGESEREDDLTKMPYKYCSTCVRTSEINGKGFFASASFRTGDVIAPAVLNGKRTPASRYMNHSPNPNSEAVIMPNGDIYFIAMSPISGCRSGDSGQEILTDYRESIKHRMKGGQICQDGSQGQ